MPPRRSRFVARSLFFARHFRYAASPARPSFVVRKLCGQAARPDGPDSAKLWRRRGPKVISLITMSRVVLYHTETTGMPLESNSAASVSPALVFELDNGSSFTFNFQMDGRVTVIGLQEGRVVTGSLSEEQAAELRDAIAEYVHKRNG